MKTILTFVCFVLLILIPVFSFAGIDLPWSTTYNCSDWLQYSDSLSCEGLDKAGAWTCSTGGANLYEQIISDANFPGGRGGKGQRHWQGDGSNVNSGGLYLYFNTPQPEFWIRWYMRYEKGFKWSSLSYDKWLYIRTGAGTDVITELVWTGIAAIAQGTPDYYQVYNKNYGWQSIYGTESDGSWFCVEIHIKMDTNSADGIGEIWIKGNKIAENRSVNWSNGIIDARKGWISVMIGSNQATPGNGRCMYVDFDDIAISATGYIGPIGNMPKPPAGLRIVQ